MKNKLILILLLVPYLFTSCISSDQSVQINDTPEWIDIDITEEEIYPFYVSEGYGITIQDASIDAINNFYEQIKNEVYIENISEFKESLITEYKYEPLNIKIEKRYYKKIINGGYIVNFLFEYDESIFQEKKEVLVSKEKEIQNKMISLENESNKLYRSNKDLDSIRILIDAYIFAMDNNKNAIANEYLDIIISRISSIKTTILPENNTLKIYMYRDESFIDPKVVNASMIALFNNIDLNFNNYLNQKELISNKEGIFIFDIEKMKMNEKGLIIFKINLYEELLLLQQKGYLFAVTSIENSINEVIYSYSRISDFSNKTIYLKTIENDVDQSSLESVTEDFFFEKISELDSKLIINNEIDLDSLSQLKAIGDYLFLFRAEIVEKQNIYKPYAISHGSLEVYDLKTESKVYDSALIDSLAINETMQESEAESILNIAKRTYYYLIR